MIQITILDIIVLLFIAIHFATPLGYYYYAKKRWLPLPWNIKLDANYQPKISIIVPTYNEEKLIIKKLNDLEKQYYPKEKLEIIIVDSSSTDKTVQLVQKWKQKHQSINIKIITEEKREGKARALNKALNYTIGEIIIITDVDAWWPSSNTISEVAKWFSDKKVGAVSCLKTPKTFTKSIIEKGYRKYYNLLRIAESKKWSTPIFHGELAAFRKCILNKLNGFPTDIGSDDSHTATRIVFEGYRAITPETIWCTELTPNGWNYHLWRIRRAQHLIQHFWKSILLKTKLKAKITKGFMNILILESYLHIFNPWLLPTSVFLLLLISLMGKHWPLILLLPGLLLLLYNPFRVWVSTQLYLIMATIRNLVSRELVWKKTRNEEI